MIVLKDMQKFENFWTFGLKFCMPVVHDHFMNDHELLANITLLREQMTLLTKFINNQITNTVDELFTNKYTNSRALSTSTATSA